MASDFISIVKVSRIRRRIRIVFVYASVGGVISGGGGGGGGIGFTLFFSIGGRHSDIPKCNCNICFYQLLSAFWLGIFVHGLSVIFFQ